MELILRIDVNIISLVLLIIVYLMSYRQFDNTDKLNRKLFVSLLAVTMGLVLETLTCIINTRHNPDFNVLTTIFHCCLFFLGPVFSFYWFEIIKNRLTDSETNSKMKTIIILVPIAINTILVLLTPFTGLIFKINGNNLYQRGPLFFLSGVTIYCYLLCGFYLVIKNRKVLLKDEIHSLIIFGSLPIVGGILQMLFYGLLLMWSSAAFSFIIFYYFLQQRMIHLDCLTRVWTRGSFEYYLNQKMEKKNNTCFGIVFIDIDNLKKINDTYGHIEGDNAIIAVADHIKKAIRKTDIIARYGGDEFVLIIDTNSKLELEQIISNINKEFDCTNRNKQSEYALTISYGADLYNSSYKSIDEFLNTVDSLMYQSKRKKQSVG